MKIIIGIMGPGEEIATETDLKNAYEIGKYCALKGYVVLTGGRKSGVMDAGLKGAKEHGGITVGILPDIDKTRASEYIDIPICTNMGAGRNFLNVISSDIIVACGMGPGTSSEVSLAIKPGKKIILVGLFEEANEFYIKLARNQIFIAKDYKEACQIIDKEV